MPDDIKSRETMEFMLQRIGVEATVVTEDSSEIQKTIIESILAADSIEEAFSDNIGGLQDARDMLGVPITISDVRWNASDYEEGLPFYGVVDAQVIENGEKFQIAVGATTAVAQLYKAQTEDAFPLNVKIVESAKQTKKGFRPYWFTLAEGPAKVTGKVTGKATKK
jgi:hypothetical protein